MSIYAVVLEIIIGNRKPAVILAAVTTKLNFDTSENSMAGLVRERNAGDSFTMIKRQQNCPGM
jgi:hypothetical protein